MISKRALAAVRSKRDVRGIVETSNEDRAFGSNDLGSNIVSIDCLHVRLDIPDCPVPVLQIDNARYEITVLGDLGTDRDCAIRLDFADFVPHQPPRQIEVVDRIVEKHHAVQACLIVAEGWSILVAPDRFEDDRVANFSAFDALHGGSICGIVTAHEPDLQLDAGFRDGLQSGVSVTEMGGKRLLTQNVLAGCGGGTYCLSVILVG